jgi:formylmethanofuran dehydrogenase subunit E
MAKRRLFIVNNPRSEAAHADFVVCHRVRDVPIVASSSTIARCRDCGERIWVSPKAPAKPPRLCRSCCKKMMAESGKNADFGISMSVAKKWAGQK